MKGAGHTSLYITILKNNTQPHPRGTQKVYLKIIKAFCCECRNVSRHPKITFFSVQGEKINDKISLFLHKKLLISNYVAYKIYCF